MRNTLRNVQQVMRQLLEEQKYQSTRDAVHIASALAFTPQCWLELTCAGAQRSEYQHRKTRSPVRGA